MKKIIFVKMLLAVLTANAGEPTTRLTNVACSNSDGTIRLYKYQTDDLENKRLNSAYLKIDTVVLGGEKHLKFNLEDLNIEVGPKTGFLPVITSTIKNWCKGDSVTFTQETVATYTFSRKDGKPLIQDDTPAPKDMSVTLLCKEKETTNFCN